MSSANMWQTATIRRHGSLPSASRRARRGIPEAGGRMIGRIVLADIEDEWKAEIWRIYIADTALRGRGLGKEAMLAMMKYCFEELNLKRLYLDHYTGNPASFLYQSLGFKYEGVLRDNCRKNGRLYDVHLMSMLASRICRTLRK